MNNLELKDIRDFLLTKNIVWKGLIYDPWIDKVVKADIEFFDDERIVRLYAQKRNNSEKYIQRVIVSTKKFLIENENLNKLDNFENFSKEWHTFFRNKKLSPATKLKHMEKEIKNLPPNTSIDFNNMFFLFRIKEPDKLKYFNALKPRLDDYIKIKNTKNKVEQPYNQLFVRNKKIAHVDETKTPKHAL